MTTRKFLHEQLYRGAEQIARLEEIHMTICGAGALGSNLADNLVRQGLCRLRVIDDDRIEEHNVGTQIYAEADVGARKVEVLRNHLFRVAGVEIEAAAKRLEKRTVRKLLKGTDLVVDTFDNADSRWLVQEYCRAEGALCLHAGLSADYCEVIWDEHYRVPQDAGEDICDYPLARNIVLLAVVLASETLLAYVFEGERNNWSATLKDFAVRALETRA